ncbi:hypothetical protein WKH56_27565 [Priestia sp. SB1]|uniref:hypothetical protein n=1 Tax=Priestia sp. SB1 TaxID=3132359 RepID=UPI0031734540
MPKAMFLTQTINYITLYFIFHFWNDSTWYQNKEKEIAFIVATYLLSLLVGWFAWLLRPIKIEIKQTNNVGSDISQTIILNQHGETKTDQSLRTIKLEVKISRRRSIWWWLLIKWIKARKLAIEVEPVPSGMLLQANERFQVSEIESSNYGFKIELSTLLVQLYNQPGTFSIGKTYLYSVTEHEDITIPSNLSSIVSPYISINSKPIKLLNLLINHKVVEHEIKFFKK